MSQIDQFRNLLFCPLDLPAPPEVDYHKFQEWHLEQIDYNKKYNKTAQLADGKQEYPWNVSWAVWWNTYDKANPWICDFDKKFPELVEYLSLFPFVTPKSISFLEQKGSREVYLHSDPDYWWGMRFYLFNTLGEKLYFVKPKEQVNERIPTMVDGKYNDLWEKTDGVKHYASFPSACCPWMLNSVRAFHGVDENVGDTGSRITAVMIGSYDYKKLYKLLKDSSEKYQSHAIWY